MKNKHNMDNQSIAYLLKFNLYNVYEARNMVEWTLGWGIAIANHHGCICNMCIDMHQNTDILIFMSIHYPPTQAFYTQCLNIDLTQLDFIDLILDSTKTSLQLVQPQKNTPSLPRLWTSWT